jgi:hypothetical protein
VASVYKQVCTSHGVNRWPYRKVTSARPREPPGDALTPLVHRSKAINTCRLRKTTTAPSDRITCTIAM